MLTTVNGIAMEAATAAHLIDSRIFISSCPPRDLRERGRLRRLCWNFRQLRSHDLCPDRQQKSVMRECHFLTAIHEEVAGGADVIGSTQCCYVDLAGSQNGAVGSDSWRER